MGVISENFADTAWRKVSWTAYDSGWNNQHADSYGYHVASIRKMGPFLHLRGCLSRNAGPADGVKLFDLPSNLRPMRKQVFVTPHGMVFAEANGSLIVNGGMQHGGETLVFLDGISISLEKVADN